MYHQYAGFELEKLSILKTVIGYYKKNPLLFICGFVKLIKCLE